MFVLSFEIGLYMIKSAHEYGVGKIANLKHDNCTQQAAQRMHNKKVNGKVLYQPEMTLANYRKKTDAHKR